MKKEISLFKMSGAGNTFSIFDNRVLKLEIETIQKYADIFSEAFGIKTEGIMAINSPLKGNSNFDVWFFNPDGSFGPMCGNGSRCAVEFSTKLGIITENQDISFTMAGSEYQAKYTKKGIAITMPDFKEFRKEVSVRIGSRILMGSYVNVGSDHYILHKNQLQIEDAEFWTYDFVENARFIRNSNEFQPRGVNVSIFMFEDEKVLMRTYERGVEAETGACGTGSISLGLVVNELYSKEFPIEIIPTSGETIWVEYKNNEHPFFTLEGNAVFLDTKTIEL